MAYLATGMAGSGFTVPVTTVRQAGMVEQEETVEGIGTAGATPLTITTIERLCLGPWCRGDVQGVCGFFPYELEWRYGFRVGILLGHDFLKGAKMGIDFQHLRLFLT
jgi:hypothetical protein